MASPDPREDGPRADALAALQRSRSSLEHRRTRSFLVTQSVLLGLAVATSVCANALGLLSDIVAIQSVAFCGATLLLTAVGWSVFVRRGITSPLVVGLLYVDSVLALFFLYVGGEFETALGLASLPIFMAPVYARRQHAFWLALFESVIFLALLLTRYLDLLPYLSPFPSELLNRPSFLADQAGSFLTVTWCVAFLAGQASLDILNSQRQLSEEVARRTDDLAHTTVELQQAKESLEELNSRLALRNRELATTNTELRDTNSALAQFNTALSHDLRAPLQTMIANADLLGMTEPPLSGHQQELLERLSAAVQRMATLIDEMHRLSRVSNRLGHMEPVQIEQIVQAAHHDLQQRFVSAGASLEVVHPLPVAMGNPALLKEVVQNLADNGVKYGAATAPRVRVESAPATPGRVAFSVEDNGDGIEPSEQHQVFRLFGRLDKHRDREGMGAGLAIVQRIVQVHGGSIRIERGQVLRGARFVVELLAAPSAAQAAGRSSRGARTLAH